MNQQLKYVLGNYSWPNLRSYGYRVEQDTLNWLKYIRPPSRQEGTPIEVIKRKREPDGLEQADGQFLISKKAQ